MSKATPMSDAERARIRELHGAGTSCNAIARQLGRSPSTVSRAAVAMGLSWDAERTAAATERKVASNRERRAATISRLYDRADRIMDRLEAKQYKLVGMDKDGYARTNHVDADAIPAADERALSATVVNLLSGAARLEAVDAGHASGTEAKGILGALDTALQAAYGSLAAGRTHVPDPDDVEDLDAG